MKELVSLISILESHIPQSGKINATVSSSPVGWHLSHSALVINQVIEGLKKSNPAEYKWKFSWPRIYVYTMGKIPRGRGKAPKSVQPTGNISADTLRNNLSLARFKLDELKILHPHNYIVHPYFGKLNVKSTLKFLYIHTKHHLEIIEDIVKG